MYSGYDDIAMSLSELSNSELINLAGLIYEILDIDNDINKLRFVKKDLIIQLLTKQINPLIKKILENAI